LFSSRVEYTISLFSNTPPVTWIITMNCIDFEDSENFNVKRNQTEKVLWEHNEATRRYCEAV
jgi:hypothetical protein